MRRRPSCAGLASFGGVLLDTGTAVTAPGWPPSGITELNQTARKVKWAVRLPVTRVQVVAALMHDIGAEPQAGRGHAETWGSMIAKLHAREKVRESRRTDHAMERNRRGNSVSGG